MIVLPAAIMPVVRQHMAWLVKADDEAEVFTSPEGMPLRRNFRQRVWLPALRAAELPVIHFHYLRHTGNQLAADPGATLRELMDRMGHSTARAAMIYLHGSDERQRAIAEALSKLAEDSRKRPGGRRSARSGHGPYGQRHATSCSLCYVSFSSTGGGMSLAKCSSTSISNVSMMTATLMPTRARSEPRA